MDKNRIIKNIFSNWAGLIVAIVVSFFLAPFVVHNLGNELYGVWTIINQFTGYMYLLDFGVRDSVIKYTSQSRAEKNNKELEKILTASLLIYIYISILTVLISVILAFLFSDIFSNIDSSISVDASIAVLLAGVSIGQFFIFNVFAGVLMGLQRYVIFNVISILTILIKATLFVILLRNGYTIVAMAATQLVLGLVGGIFILVYAKKMAHIHDFKFKFSFKMDYDFREKLRKVANYSTYALINNLGQKIVFLTDAIVIGIFLPVASVTFYAIAGTLIDYLRKLVSVTAQVLMPLVAHYSALDDSRKIIKTVVDGSKLTLFVSFPIALVFIVLGGKFIMLWMGEEYQDLSGQVLMILAITQIFSAPHQTLSSVLYGLEKHKMLAYFRVGEAISNLLLSIILLQYYGIIGVAFGTAIPHILLTAVILPIYTTKVVGMGLIRYYTEGYVRPFLAAIPFLVVVTVIDNSVEIGNLGVFFFLVGIASFIYLLSSYLIIFSASERKLLNKEIEKLF
jgi:O-antigen/teichoic acid export membrane protein